MGCSVVDCANDKLTKHKYCNPYACTSEKTEPIIATFNVSTFRTQYTSAILTWTKVNPPYKYMHFEYIVSANDEQIYQGRVKGCSFEVTICIIGN
jgi:hypothetical protein